MVVSSWKLNWVTAGSYRVSCARRYNWCLNVSHTHTHRNIFTRIHSKTLECAYKHTRIHTNLISLFVLWKHIADNVRCCIIYMDTYLRIAVVNIHYVWLFIAVYIFYLFYIFCMAINSRTQSEHHKELWSRHHACPT